MTLDEIFNNGKQFAKFAFEEQGGKCCLCGFATMPMANISRL